MRDDGWHTDYRQGLPCWIDDEDIDQDVLVARLRGKKRTARQIAMDHLRHFNGVRRGHPTVATKLALMHKPKTGFTAPKHWRDAVEARILVSELMPRCSAREQRVLYLRYWKGMQGGEIATLFAVSAARVFQIIAEALRRMRGDNGRIRSDAQFMEELEAPAMSL